MRRGTYYLRTSEPFRETSPPERLSQELRVLESVAVVDSRTAAGGTIIVGSRSTGFGSVSLVHLRDDSLP